MKIKLNLKTRIFSVLFIAVSSFYSWSQATEDTEKDLEYHSFSVSPLLGFYSDFDNNQAFFSDPVRFSTLSNSGITLGADVSFKYLQKHLFTLSLYTGSEVKLFGTSGGFFQISALYGREFSLTRTLFFDAHIGAGYFSYKTIYTDILDSRFNQYEARNTITFPIVAKFRVKTGPRFSLGLQIQASINNVKPIYMTGLILQWNSIKK